MTKQIVFSFTLLITLGVFSFTIMRIVRFFRFTRPAFPIKDFGKRINVMLQWHLDRPKYSAVLS